MTDRGRSTLAAAFLLPSMLAAQQPLDSVRAAALRDAERFAACMASTDEDCVVELTDRQRAVASGWLSSEWAQRENLEATRRRTEHIEGYYRRMEVAEPWPLIAADGALFTLVPYLYTFGVERRGERTDLMGYLIGASDDDGESWRFIQVLDIEPLVRGAADRVIPEYDDGPTPVVTRIRGDESPFEKSRWLETTERRFVVLDQGIGYDLQFEVRNDLDSQIDLIVHYDDPADRDRPLEFHGSLDPGQRVLQWQSPPLVDFEPGATYNVVVNGADPATGRLLFEHREKLLFLPTREIWLHVMSKPPP